MKDPVNKAALYLYDPEAEYTYNAAHGTEYPYNGFPTGQQGRKYKKTRFINWEPIPEDIIIRHSGSQIFVNFSALFPNDVTDPAIQLFQMRTRRLDLQNLICEQINFFTALYDDDNDLITSMLIAKYMTDSQTYTIVTFDEYQQQLFEILFPERTIDKIRKMVDENDVGDDVTGLFPEDMIRDIFIVSFMIKVMHIFIEHFIISTGNSPKDLYKLFASAFTNVMNYINPNIYVLLYDYVYSSVQQSCSSNSNIYDMQAIDGVTIPTTTLFVMRKSLLCDGLIKLTFASAWDKLNKRPTYSCVGLIKAIITQAAFVTRKVQLRYSLVNVDDVSQLLSDQISNSSPISMVRSFNPGEYMCTYEDLSSIIAEIARTTDLSPLDFYLKNIPQLNELSTIIIQTMLYNKFHSSINPNNLNMKQKYIILLYVRKCIMQIYGLTEQQTITNPLINMLMAKTVTHTTKTLTAKDLNSIRKYVKLNNLKQYLLNDKNVTTYIEAIMHSVLSSFTIVNHNDPSLLDTPLTYDANAMTLSLLDMCVALFDFMDPANH